MTHEQEVVFAAADGWEIAGRLHVPDQGEAVPGVVLVPASRHERDAFQEMVAPVAERGIATLRIDVRGRGASAGARRYEHLAPGQRRAVALDVRAALQRLADDPGVDGSRLAVVAEQDTAADALAGVEGIAGVRAAALLSPRRGTRLVEALARHPMAVLALASVEDRAGVAASVDAYLAALEDGSRLQVVHGLGFGVTMLSVQRFERPDDEPLALSISDWLADRLA